MDKMIKTTIVGGVVEGMLNQLLAPPNQGASIQLEPVGPSPEEIKIQHELDEQQRLEFLRSNAQLSKHLKGPGATSYLPDENIGQAYGLHLKQAPPPVTSPSDKHIDFFGSPGSSEETTVALLRDPGLFADGIDDPVVWKRMIQQPGLTQEERERLFLRQKVGVTVLDDHPMIDARAFAEKEKWTDPFLDVALAAAEGGATSVSVSLFEEGGKRTVKAFGQDLTKGSGKKLLAIIDAKEAGGFDELLMAGKLGADRPQNTAEGIIALGDYAMTKAPSWAIIADGAVNAVGSGTRQAIVRYWADHDSQQEYDPTPVATAKTKWNGWLDEQGHFTQAVLNRIGAGQYK